MALPPRFPRIPAALAAALALCSAAIGPLRPASADPAPPPVPGTRLLQAASPRDTPVVNNPFTVIVEAARQAVPLKDVPAAATVLGPRDLARLPRGVAADEALAGVPGVRVDNQADGERVHVSIRGQGVLTESGIRGIKVLLDGLPLNDPTGVAPDLYDVDWSTVERVEVLRGPAGALYGGGGSGGVINVVTRDGGAPGRGLVSGQGGSYGFVKSLAEGGGRIGGADYRLSLSRASADGWRQHTAFWGDNLYAKLHWAPGPRLDLRPVFVWTDHFEQNAEGLNRAQFSEDPRQANPDAIPKNEYYKVSRVTGGLTARIATAPGQSLELLGLVRRTRYAEPRPGEIIRRTLLTPGATLQYDAAVATGTLRHHLSAGSDLTWQSIDESRFENLGGAVQGDRLAKGKVKQGSQGVFAMDRVELARAWTATVAGRWDAIQNHVDDLLDPAVSMSKDFERATGRAGLAWAVSTPLNLYANGSMGFLPPATAELLNNPEGLGGFNRSLTFSTSTSEEIGARGLLPHAVSYELTGFALQTKDDIGRFRLPPSTGRGGIDFYRNVGDTRRFGVESRLGWTAAPWLSLEGAYTWSRFQYDSPAGIDGNWLPNSPEHMLNLACEVRPTRNLTLGVESEMQSHWAVSTSNAAWAPGFALWGAHASYAWKGAVGGEVSVTARNVFSAKYMAFTEPDFDDGTGVVVDVWNSYQPGPPAEVYARLTLTR